MASKTIGIEIGSDSLKVSVVKGKKIQQMVSVKLPDHMIQEGRVLSPDALSNFLKEVLNKNHIRGGVSALVLPPQLVIGLQLTLPMMNESELLLNLPFEFHDYVGKDSDEFDYDYIINSVEGNFVNIYAAAVSRKPVEEYWSIFKKAGLKLKAAMPPEMAWLNVLSHAQQVPKKLAIVDIGHTSTRVSIFANGNFVMCKAIDFAGQLFDETIVSQLHIDPHAARNRKEANQDDILLAEYMQQPYGAVAIDVMRTISFYNYSLPAEEEPLKDIYYCGGSSNIELLRTAIKNATELNLAPISQLIEQDNIDQEEALTSALSVGAALQLQ